VKSYPLLSFLAALAYLCLVGTCASAANLIVALGDAFTYEATAFVPCPAASLTPSYACPDGDGYLTVVAKALDQPTAFQNLSFPAADTVSVPLYQIPMMTPAATVVILFIGNNDRQPIAYGRYPLQKWKEDYDLAIAAAHARAPHARLILATLPNPAYVPFFVSGAINDRLNVEQRKLVGADTLAMDGFIAGHKEDILDLRCDADFYTEATLDADKLHPNNVGYAHIAGRVIAILRSPIPARAKKSCPPFTNRT
jgi:hypothetical protein